LIRLACFFIRLLMMEETHHFVLSRFERTRNSLDRILTILFFFRRKRDMHRLFFPVV
jgi:hypothetical protein